MADFNYYLNRQGPQGVQGPQGEEGFSPTVTINTNTSEEFTLLITNEDGSYVTPNLRGDQINNEGGTYVRYDQATNTLYAGEADEAGVGIRGEVVLASDEDIELGTTGVVITADQFKEAMDALIAQVVPGNGQITIKQGGVVKGTFTVNQAGDTVIELVEGTSITVDSSLSTTSENPVQNKVITTALNNKANRSEIPDVSNFATKTELEEVEAEIPDVSGFATSAALAQETSTRVSEDTRIEAKVDSIVIPTVNDGQLTITQGGSTLGVFTANQSGNVTVDLPTGTTVNNGNLTINVNGTNAGSFSANQAGDSTVNITVPTSSADLSDGSTLVTTTTLATELDNYVATSDITTTLSSSSTDSEVPGAATVYNAIQSFTPDLSNYVTLNTEQNITSRKSFYASTSSDNGVLYIQNNRSSNTGEFLKALSINAGTYMKLGSFRPSAYDLINCVEGSGLLLKSTGGSAENGKGVILASTLNAPKFRKLSNGSSYTGTDYDIIHAGNISSYIPSVSTATTTTPGIVQPDGVTITVDSNGVISGAPSGPQIDDTTTSASSVWSSDKTNTAIQAGDAAVLETVNESFLGNDDIIAGSGITISSSTTTTGTTENTQLTISSNVDVSNLATKAEVTTAITSATSTMVSSATVRNIVTITQADYDALQTKEADTEYHITDAVEPALADLTNCTNVADIKMAHNAMPSNTYTDLTLGASGTEYIAPADGYVYLAKIAGSDFYYAEIYAVLDGTNNTAYGVWDDAYRTSPIALVLPVRKGVKFKVEYNATGTTNYFRFIYAQGSESEAQ